MIAATLRQDTSVDITVIVHDSDGNELGSVTFFQHSNGLNVEVWKDEDTRLESVVVK